ncbi:MAG: urate hydroxylase PuuD, partial [Hyphomicrobiales bacterium]|nr:urate hydroxylase PuuD [Hyphomicrobiales bacterium]
PQIGWFRWEAYVVWLSGLALMALRYFWQADLYLIDLRKAALLPWQAVALALAGLVVGWLAYDFICKRAWDEPVRRAAIFILLGALSYVYADIFSGRGAFIEIGAITGTIMAANVAHVLVPNQRRMLAAARAREPQDEARFAASRQRALHNNYLGIPVVFLMLSTHYPLAFAGRYNWIVIALSFVVGAAIRHFFIARHRGQGALWWTLAVAILGAALMVWLSFAGAEQTLARARPTNAIDAIASVMSPDFGEVEDIVSARCVACHAKRPAWAGLATAPRGMLLDTPALIRAHAQDIARAAIWTRVMPPPGVDAGMTDDERATLAAWLKAGAPAR